MIWVLYVAKSIYCLTMLPMSLLDDLLYWNFCFISSVQTTRAKFYSSLWFRCSDQWLPYLRSVNVLILYIFRTADPAKPKFWRATAGGTHEIQGYLVAYRISLDEEQYASYMAVSSISTSDRFSLIAGVDVQTWKLAPNTDIAYWKEQTHRLLFAMLSTVISLFTRES